ncbi:MAG: DUF5011 domain-containing protein [Opitutaceae bacterium]|jgi:autotransporter-associated beta strand protein|nr:DUF5011 domain-containing protein [Opitutaceae bacterium]
MKKPAVSKRPYHSAATLAALSITASAYLQASTIWDGGGASPTWGTPENWSDDIAPTFDNTADISFPTSAVPNFNTALGAARTVRSLSFGADVDGPLSVSFQTALTAGAAARLTFDTDEVGGNATITVDSGASGNITLGNSTLTGTTEPNPYLADNLVINHNGTGLLLINRPFQAAAFGITKNGTGTFQTNNNNLLTGPLNINGGRFIANTSSTGGQDLSSFSAINLNGATLQIAANGNSKTYSAGPIAVTAPSTLEYRNPSNTTYNAVFSGAAVAFALNDDLTVKNLSVNTGINNQITVSRPVTGAGDITVEGFNHLLSDADNPAFGRFTLSGNNSGWTGDLFIKQGSAGFGGDVRNSSLGSGQVYLGETGSASGASLHLVSFGFSTVPMTVNKNITVRSGGFRSIRLFSDNTYTFGGTITLENDLTLSNGGFFNTYNLIINGNITGSGNLNISETGNNVKAAYTRLGGNNTYSGSTNIGANVSNSTEGATLSVLSTSGNAIPDTSAVNLLAADTLLTVDTSETVGSISSSGAFGTVNIANGVVLTTGVTNASTSFDGTIIGMGSLTKAGTGAFTVSGNNTYSGTTNVGAGVLKIQNGNGLGYGGIQNTATNPTVVASGAVLDLNGATSVTEPIVLSGSGIGGTGALINSSSSPASISNNLAGILLGATSTGSNYSAAPTVNISGGGGSGATATATLGVTAATFGTVTVNGTYTTPPTVNIFGGGGVGATATVDVNGVLTITNPGTGYTSAPNIGFVGGEGGTSMSATGNASSFTVSGVSLTSPGTGYTSAPTYTFSEGNAVPGTVEFASVTLATDSTIGGTGDITILSPVTESGGARSLTKVGANTVTLAAPAYSGDTIVSAGKLSLAAANTANQTASVHIATGAVLELAFTGTDTVDKLFLNGVQQPAGTYTSAHASGAFQGGGSLVVTSSPGSGDVVAPVITRNGAASVQVSWGGSYSDAGATASDNVDPSVSVITTITPGGSVNTSKPGTYTVTYTAADAAGNNATPVTRTVVVAIDSPTTVGADGYAPLMKYALGATSPSASVQAPVITSTASTLSLTAIVRTDDPSLSVTAQTNTDLASAGSWTTTGVSSSLAADQTNVPAGCVRRVYSVSLTGQTKRFLRLVATNGAN